MKITMLTFLVKKMYNEGPYICDGYHEPITRSALSIF